MIVTKHVKGAVYDQSKQLLSCRNALPPGVIPGDLSADVDVPNYRASLSDAGEAKGYHISGAMMPEVAIVQLRHCGSPD
ncbi:MAG: hypothetical protein NVSMB53_11720 [Gemmatimonadaceae bacterium]